MEYPRGYNNERPSDINSEKRGVCPIILGRQEGERGLDIVNQRKEWYSRRMPFISVIIRQLIHHRDDRRVEGYIGGAKTDSELPWMDGWMVHDHINCVNRRRPGAACLYLEHSPTERGIFYTHHVLSAASSNNK